MAEMIVIPNTPVTIISNITRLFLSCFQNALLVLPQALHQDIVFGVLLVWYPRATNILINNVTLFISVYNIKWRTEIIEDNSPQ